MKINKKAEEGEVKLHAFVQGLMERNRVPHDQREEEEERLKKLIRDRVLREALEALPDEDLDEIEKGLDDGEDFSIEKWNSMLFVEGVRPESIVNKVLQDVEQEYLGVENAAEEETLIERQEEE